MVNIKNYPKQAILKLCEAIGGETTSYDWLMQNHYRELAAFCDGFLYKNLTALNWLDEHQFHPWHALISCLTHNDYEAQDYLFNGPYKILAGVAYAAEGNQEAVAWLNRNNLSHFTHLAQCLYMQWDDSDSSFRKNWKLDVNYRVPLFHLWPI